MKVDILDSLRAFIKDGNFTAMREFLFFHDGAATLGRWIKDDMEFVNADKKKKIQWKLFGILNELLRADHSILSKQSTRVVFGNDADLIAVLLKFMKDADLSDVCHLGSLNLILLVLTEIGKKSPQLTSTLVPALNAHREALKAFENADKKERIDELIELVEATLRVVTAENMADIA